MKLLVFILTTLYCLNASAFTKILYKQEELDICPNQKIFFNEKKYNASFIENKDFNLDISKLKLPKKLNSWVAISNLCSETLDKELDYLNCLGNAKENPSINKFNHLHGKSLNIDKFIKQTNIFSNKSNYYIISYSSPDNMILNNRNSIYEIIIIKYNDLIKLMPEFKQNFNQNKFFCNSEGH
jgi:hypothetical protein